MWRGTNQLPLNKAFYPINHCLYFEAAQSHFLPQCQQCYSQHTMLINVVYTIGCNKWPQSCSNTEMQLSDLIKSILIFCKCVSVLWTLFFLHKREKREDILRIKKKKKSIWLLHKILQELLGFFLAMLMSLSLLMYYQEKLSSMWEGAIHKDPLILVCHMDSPSVAGIIWLLTFSVPAACLNYQYVHMVLLFQTQADRKEARCQIRSLNTLTA